MSGAENIAKLFAKTTRRYPEHGNTPRTRHLVLNPIVEISASSDTAASRSTFCVVQNTETVPLQPIVVGRYFDAFSCDDAGWYFTERKVEIQMVGDVSAHLMVDPRAVRRIGSGATLSASTLMYRVLGGRRPTPAPAPATTARGHGRMPNTW